MSGIAAQLVADPTWWHLSRSAAIVAWVLLTAALVWGVLIHTRVLRPLGRPAAMVELHRTLGTVGLAAILIHVGALLADRAFPLSLADVAVPGHSSWKPFGMALGILASYLVLAVQASSWLRHRLPVKAWRAIHLGAYAAWLLVAFHAGLVGTDVVNRAYQLTALLTTGAVVTMVSVRLLVDRNRAAPAVRRQRANEAQSAGTRTP